MTRTGLIGLAVIMTSLCGAAAGAATPEADDIALLDDIGGMPETTASPGECLLHDVAIRAPADGRRFYVAGILGESFATLADPFYGDDRSNNGSIFTAGGAAGIACTRDNGQWRFEIEGAVVHAGRARRRGQCPPATWQCARIRAASAT